jgi:hypothetical protein
VEHGRNSPALSRLAGVVRGWPETELLILFHALFRAEPVAEPCTARFNLYLKKRRRWSAAVKETTMNPREQRMAALRRFPPAGPDARRSWTTN